MSAEFILSIFQHNDKTNNKHDTLPHSKVTACGKRLCLECTCHGVFMYSYGRTSSYFHCDLNQTVVSTPERTPPPPGLPPRLPRGTYCSSPGLRAGEGGNLLIESTELCLQRPGRRGGARREGRGRRGAFAHACSCLWCSGAGADEDRWHQVRGGLAHAVLPEAFLPGPRHRQADRRILLYEVSASLPQPQQNNTNTPQMRNRGSGFHFPPLNYFNNMYQ